MRLWFFLSVIIFTSFASGQSRDDGDSYVVTIQKKQAKRAAERFDIIQWIRGFDKIKAQQDAKYGRGSGKYGGASLDIVLNHNADSGEVKRDGTKIGKDTRSMGKVQVYLDDLFTSGNKTRHFNIDLGAEAFLSQTTKFEPDPNFTQEQHSYSEMGGGLLIRPLGRSSQDSGLTLKGGYVNVTQTGLWSNNTQQVAMYGTYLGAEAKLYLLPFLGIRGDYIAVLDQQIGALNGAWKMNRVQFGGFLEVYLLNLGVYMVTTEHVFTPNPTENSAPVKEVYSGVGFTGTLHF